MFRVRGGGVPASVAGCGSLQKVVLVDKNLNALFEIFAAACVAGTVYR